MRGTGRVNAEKQREKRGEPSQLDPTLLAILEIPHPASIAPIPTRKPWTDAQETLMMGMVATHLAQESAAFLVGIHERQLQLWIARGDAWEDNDRDRDADPEVAASCAELSHRLKSAWSYAERLSLARIAAAPAWQAHAWLLERTRQRKYAIQPPSNVGQVIVQVGLVPGRDGMTIEGRVKAIHADELPALRDPRRPELPPAEADGGAKVGGGGGFGATFGRKRKAHFDRNC